MPGPLEGFRVLELATVVLGPMACQTLGDLGADIIKVEPPNGDSSRNAGPARHRGMASLFLGCNRNKRSVVLDLKDDGGRAALLRLASKADVVVHNYRPAALLRLGLGYEAVAALNPGIVFCGTYGYGRRGPYAERGAYDDSIQAISGIAGLAARRGGEPQYAATILGDKTTAMAVVSSVLAALLHRARTGRGQEIEVPMFETLVSYVLTEHLSGATFDPPIGDGPGYARTLSRRPFQTADGHISVLPYMDEHWRAFCRAAGRPDLETDPRFATFAQRIARSRECYDLMAEVLRTRSTSEWLGLLGATTVPAVPVNRLEDLFEDEHLEATGFWTFADHETEGRLRIPGVPWSFFGSPAELRRLPPRLGEHSREVLAEHGLSNAEIDALIAAGVTRTAD